MSGRRYLIKIEPLRLPHVGGNLAKSIEIFLFILIPTDQKDHFIQYLAERHQEELLTRKAMEFVLEDFMERQKSLEEQMASLRVQQQDQAAQCRALQARHKELERELAEERDRRQSAERNVRDLREQLDYAHQERFGDRRQHVRKKDKSGKPAPAEPDRQEEKKGYDGTDDP